MGPEHERPLGTRWWGTTGERRSSLDSETTSLLKVETRKLRKKVQSGSWVHQFHHLSTQHLTLNIFKKGSILCRMFPIFVCYV